MLTGMIDAFTLFISILQLNPYGLQQTMQILAHLQLAHKCYACTMIEREKFAQP